MVISPREYEYPVVDPRRWPIWVMEGVAGLAAVMVVAFWYLGVNTTIPLVVLALDVLAFSHFVHQISDPYIGLVYKKGKLVGVLLPGSWWIVIPHLPYSIEPLDMSRQEGGFEERMHVNRSGRRSEKIPIRVRVKFYYRVDPAGLGKLMAMPPRRMKERAEVVGQSVLSAKLGAMTYDSMIEGKVDLEKQMVESLRGAFSKDGYIIEDFVTFDFLSSPMDEAANSRVKAEAEAENMEKFLRASADPLKDNFNMTLISLAKLVITGAGRIFEHRDQLKQAPKSGVVTGLEMFYNRLKGSSHEEK